MMSHNWLVIIIRKTEWHDVICLNTSLPPLFQQRYGFEFQILKCKKRFKKHWNPSVNILSAGQSLPLSIMGAGRWCTLCTFIKQLLNLISNQWISRWLKSISLNTNFEFKRCWLVSLDAWCHHQSYQLFHLNENSFFNHRRRDAPL